MKITPIMTGGTPGADLGNSNAGHTASPDKLARAKQIASGSIIASDTPTDPTLVRQQQTVRRITMNTNQTTNRPIEEATVSEAKLPITDSNDITPVVEDTKPLSPQFAALARQRRALQVKEREIADRERALSSQPTSVGTEELVSRLKSNPLSVLQENGITYDQLTEAILSDQTTHNPDIQALKAEIKALKEGVDKNLADRDTQAEQQVLAEIRRETERLASDGDTYEMVRATRSYPEVVNLIHRTFKETGEILDTSEAMRLVEEDLLTETLKVATLGKVKSRLTPPAPPQPQPAPKQFRTLTNRDTASPISDRRSRAIAAALGNLKK
jgi:hypothetical protein